MSDWAQPLIGPGVPGPARVSYLPRLWLRSCLRQRNLLSVDAVAETEFEETLALLGAKNDLAMLTDGLPTYVEFERRFLGSVAPLSESRISAFNDAVHGIALRLPIELDTWSRLHEFVTSGGSGEIVPAISSTSTGPLGATHLPRMWAKALLTATGHIPPGYNSGAGGGDTFTVTRLGLDMQETVSMISGERPTYLEFETWVRKHGRSVDAATIAQYNADAAKRDKPPEMAAEIRLMTGVDDASLTRTVILNDLEDWHAIHRSLSEKTSFASRRTSGPAA
jgi:hypothetical protein